MQAIIVAGGRGTRMSPLTTSIPKPMLKVGDKPILEHILNYLKKNGIKDIIISVGYLKNQIISNFGNGSRLNLSIQYIYEDAHYPLGTAGAVVKAKKFIKNAFLVTYADILRELDIRKMADFHKSKKAFATIAAYKNYHKNPKSIILFDKRGKISSFRERPAYNPKKNYCWSNASLYILEPQIFDYIPLSYTDFGSDIFPMLIKDKKRIYAYKSYGKFIDIGSRRKLESANKIFFA